jgi:lipopolysaccharide/colanic/teichoic acid biosynthesis glycosyltransferase
MQRFFDIFFSLIALIGLAPLLIPVAIILRFTGEGEVFFRQKRVGFKGQEFGIYKFATMLKNSPTIGAGTVTVKNDQRILPFGRLLRRTKLNELPQLLNILFGDMSVVGPRPLVRKGFEAYDSDTQKIVSSVKPGLSGIGSLVFRNEEEILHRINDQMDYYYKVIGPYKGELERWYAQNNSIGTYFKVIGATFRMLVKPDVNHVFEVFSGLPRPPAALEKDLFELL